MQTAELPRVNRCARATRDVRPRRQAASRTLDGDLIAELSAALRSTVYLPLACALVGVGLQAVRRWLARGRRELRRRERPGTLPSNREAVYADLVLALKRSLARAEADCVAAVLEAGKVHWRALVWFLERRWPERWGKQAREIREQARSLRGLERRIRSLGRQPR